MTAALDFCESSIGSHESRDHGRDQLPRVYGLTCLSCQRFSVSDEISMNRRGQLDSHLYRFVVLKRRDFQLCHRTVILRTAQERDHD